MGLPYRPAEKAASAPVQSSHVPGRATCPSGQAANRIREWTLAIERPKLRPNIPPHPQSL
jgi:hypothetical protein